MRCLRRGRPLTRDVKVEPKLKELSEFRVMGKPMLRRDSRAKVTGEAKYAADIRLPGMLYARDPSAAGAWGDATEGRHLARA